MSFPHPSQIPHARDILWIMREVHNEKLLTLAGLVGLIYHSSFAALKSPGTPSGHKYRSANGYRQEQGKADRDLKQDHRL